jgi:hypothetical protein
LRAAKAEPVDDRDSIVVGWGRLIAQGVACGVAFAAVLVLRSRTSLDIIYFQF